MKKLRAQDTRAGMLLVAFLALVWNGCASLPDVAPFVDATVQLRSAIIASGAAVEAELRQIPENETNANTLSDRWKLRIQAGDALVSYSESLAAIVQSGQEGAQAARTLADSAAGLAKAVGVALPPAGAVATVTDVAAFVYGHIAAARASRSLEDALVNVQPAVEQLTGLMGRDLKDIEDILRAAHEQQLTRLNQKYNEELGYFKDLTGEQRKIYQKPARGRDDEKRLLEIGQPVESTKVWRDSMEAERQQADKRLKAGPQLIVTCRQALTE